MGVKYVLSEPTPPGWWAKNKALVCSVASLLAGLYLGGGCDQKASPAPSQTPTPSAPPTHPSKD
ncbi:hypothetical protein FCH28_37570 [Streptomyces piniterrae]|uniref:Uncharacterized protein n=1 Tax=Streptomyces piniterrae TaxID=2571125 RepID=A0A4U0MKT5_9ACTN|nr:hypothetical protein [Streptomyces piniterrae]TJZ41199.1 hypothetical protein FCH28_37570 [Streptomyces piniterrae]